MLQGARVAWGLTEALLGRLHLQSHLDESELLPPSRFCRGPRSSSSAPVWWEEGTDGQDPEFKVSSGTGHTEDQRVDMGHRATAGSWGSRNYGLQGCP